MKTIEYYMNLPYRLELVPDTDVTSDVILAETVIVRSVPETFLQLN